MERISVGIIIVAFTLIVGASIGLNVKVNELTIELEFRSEFSNGAQLATDAINE